MSPGAQKAVISLVSALTPFLVGWLAVYKPTAAAGQKSQTAQFMLGKELDEYRTLLADQTAKREVCLDLLTRCRGHR